MRGIGRHLQNPTVAGRNLVFASSSFSTSSFGRGRGRGTVASDAPPTAFTPAPPPNPQRPQVDPPPAAFGHGQGRGKPLTPPPHSAPLPLLARPVSQSAGRGRGAAAFLPNPAPVRPAPLPRDEDVEGSERILAPPRLERVVPGTEQVTKPQMDGAGRGREIRPFSELKISNMSSSGFGRGKADKPAAPDAAQQKEVNRHMKVVQQLAGDPSAPKLSPEAAVKKAMEILRKKSEAAGDSGRGRGRGMQMGRGRGRGRRDAEEDDLSEMSLGDDADGEKLARRLGPEKMNQLNEAFEEIGYRVLPLPLEDAYEDALHTNYAIELEPEWHFGDLNSNPDIHDTPPISLRDALEKVKPFLMAYENIRSQEEWEEVVEETMNKKLPIIKEIVDHYAGVDVVTALQQQKELNRVADTLPKRSPASIKKFASNSILSLQSNPGWGFDKKCQFMDKLVMEVSQHYK
uniref:Hydroxyproline-rich glycoprotein family protein n=1 Tax=Kalanchoe fedtschenkoi TaxID=63787 RepID=A0A7N0ZSI3_KALFE